MKCPKCGYNSFEYYDVCKKCSTDLVAFKMEHSISSIVLPMEAKEKLSAESRTLETAAAPSSKSVEVHDDIFSFDLPDEQESDSVVPPNEPINFDTVSPFADIVTGSPFAPQQDSFSDFTDPEDTSPFGTVSTGFAAAPAEETVDLTSTSTEFDFSWDDTPPLPVAPEEAGTAEPDSNVELDDFDSLFDEKKENRPK